MREQIEQLMTAEQEDLNEYSNKAIVSFEQLTELWTDYKEQRKQMWYSKGRRDAFKVILAMLDEKEG